MSDDFGIIPKSVHIDPRTDPLSWADRKALVMFMSECDDYGRFHGSPRALSRLLGGSTEEIESDIAKLEAHKVVSRYRVTVKATKIEYYVSEITGWDAYLGHNKKRKAGEQRDGMFPDRNGVFPKARSHRTTVNDSPGITDGDGGDSFQAQPGGVGAESGEPGRNGAAPGELGRPRIGLNRAEQRSDSGANQPAPPERPTAGPTAGALDAPPRGSSRPDTVQGTKPKVRRLDADAVAALSPDARREYKAARKAQRDAKQAPPQPVAIVAPPPPVQPPKPPEPTPEEQARAAAERADRERAWAEKREAARVEAEAAEAKRKADMADRADMLARARADMARQTAEADASKLPWPSEALELRCARIIASFAHVGSHKRSTVSLIIGDLMARAGVEVATRALDRVDAMGQAWEGWRKQDPWEPITQLLADAAKPILAPVPDP